MKVTFGDKNDFCIEIHYRESADKGGIVMWMKNESFGTENHEADLIHSIRNLKKLERTYQDLTFPSDVKHDPDALVDWMLSIDLARHPTKSNMLKWEARTKYIRFLGDQLDRFSMLCFYENQIISWILKDNIKSESFKFDFKHQSMMKVVKDYIKWYEQLNGEVKVNLHSFP